MKLEKGDKLLMIGDSITDCGRARPVGEGLFDSRGNGYVNLVYAHLWAAYPELLARVVNMGCSGDRVSSLKDRWQTDVMEQRPDWLSIMIGINDVWRQFDLPQMPETHLLLDEYENTLDELVERTLPALKGLVLMTPFYIEPNAADPMRAMMDKYGEVVKSIAKKYDVLCVDTQAAFNKVLEHLYPAALAWDRVHPTTAGHMVIAHAFLETIGFER